MRTRIDSTGPPTGIGVQVSSTSRLVLPATVTVVSKRGQAGTGLLRGRVTHARRWSLSASRRFSGRIKSASRQPIAAHAGRSKRRSAAGFQAQTAPAGSMTIQASWAAASRSSSCQSRLLRDAGLTGSIVVLRSARRRDVDWDSAICSVDLLIDMVLISTSTGPTLGGGQFVNGRTGRPSPLPAIRHSCVEPIVLNVAARRRIRASTAPVTGARGRFGIVGMCR